MAHRVAMAYGRDVEDILDEPDTAFAERVAVLMLLGGN